MRIDKINRLYRAIADPPSKRHCRASREADGWEVSFFRPGKFGTEEERGLSDAQFLAIAENEDVEVIIALDFRRQLIFIPGVFKEPISVLADFLKNPPEPKTAPEGGESPILGAEKEGGA